MAGSGSWLAKAERVERQWFVVDAADRPIGRLATQIARILTGKHRPTFTPHVDTGDFVIVINAAKVRLTGRKGAQSHYHYHTGHSGGYRSIPWDTMLQKKPEFLFEHVVKGMLPKTRLRYERKLKVYAGSVHPHSAQLPVALDL
ncbi:MAG: 50S ribosomal protein L13 [Synergistaceae bacterium]|jgi:large subunit ribosomal protein L13|nr:50S ribosomal protein L13 [Synergistaceae bacterium]